MTRAEFADAYTRKLKEAMRRSPDDYIDGPERAHLIVEKMITVVEREGATRVMLGPALKATLRSFALPVNYGGLKQAREQWMST